MRSGTCANGLEWEERVEWTTRDEPDSLPDDALLGVVWALSAGRAELGVPAAGRVLPWPQTVRVFSERELPLRFHLGGWFNLQQNTCAITVPLELERDGSALILRAEDVRHPSADFEPWRTYAFELRIENDVEWGRIRTLNGEGLVDLRASAVQASDAWPRESCPDGEAACLRQEVWGGEVYDESRLYDPWTVITEPCEG